MTTLERRETEHEILIAAPAERVYRILADVRQWPSIFPPTIHAQRVAGDDRAEQIRLWATANGEVKSWQSRRELSPTERRIVFGQEKSAPPIASMGGMWLVDPTPDGGSQVRLTHYYEADSAENLGWIDRTVETNSQAELEALRTHVESALGAELTFSFEDTVLIHGEAKDVFDFIADAERWPDRLPHVSRVRMDTDANGVQTLEMDTSTQHGATHTTKSYRVLLSPFAIAYKQVTLPSLLTVHTGYWHLTRTEQGVEASSQHTVVLNPANIRLVLGENATIAEGREHVREALSGNSLATLGCAKRYAEDGPR